MILVWEAEDIAPDGWKRLVVPPGTEVFLGRGVVGIVSQAALDCDCGKGVDCTYVTKQRTGL